MSSASDQHGPILLPRRCKALGHLRVAGALNQYHGVDLLFSSMAAVGLADLLRHGGLGIGGERAIQAKLGR